MIYQVTAEQQADIDCRFTYHKPGGDQTQRYQALRGYAHGLAMQLMAMVPPSRERSMALTRLEEAIFWANAGIARNEQHFEAEPLKVELPAGYPPLSAPQPQTVQVEPMGQAPATPTYIPPAGGDSPLSE
jgi:hypothetical protein